MPLTDKDGRCGDVRLAHVRVGRRDGYWQTLGISKVPGLVLSAESLDELVDKIRLCAGDLLVSNCPKKHYDGLLIDLVAEFKPPPDAAGGE